MVVMNQFCELRIDNINHDKICSYLLGVCMAIHMIIVVSVIVWFAKLEDGRNLIHITTAKDYTKQIH